MFRTPTFFPSAFCGGSCTRHELSELTRLAAPVRFGGGQTIFSEGERAESAFGLSRGVVRLYKLLPDGRRQIVAFALPGDFLAMRLADRFNFSADAIGDVNVSRFPRESPDSIQPEPSAATDRVRHARDARRSEPVEPARQRLCRREVGNLSCQLAQPFGAIGDEFAARALADATSGYC